MNLLPNLRKLKRYSIFEIILYSMQSSSSPSLIFLQGQKV